MAKQKRKKTKDSSFEHGVELYGLFLILCSILGIGKYGPVGRMIASFGLFLVGSIYMVFLLSLLIVGVYLILKRKWPDFFSTKLIGIYVFILGFLTIMHREFVVQNDGNMMVIFKETMNQLTAGFNSLMKTGNLDNLLSYGGGILGASLAIVSDKLFSVVGMQIVAWILMVAGVCIFTGFSILDFIRDSYEKGVEKTKERKQKRVENSKDDEENASSHVIISNGNEEILTEEKDPDKHIKISSIDEISKIEQSKKQEDQQLPIEIPKEEKATVIHNNNYTLPSIDLLEKVKSSKKGTDQEKIEHYIVVVEQVLRDFGISGKVVEVHVGPSVTQYELEIKSGTKVSKILSLNREISLALAKKDVRIEAPIPGKSTVGIEIPNDSVAAVSFREVLEKVPESKKNSKLLVPLGKNIMGNVIWCEIDKTPHLLVAGATGSGKSVCVNGIISSILMRTRPDEVKLVMVDPKKVELSVYNGIPHLLCPVVTDPKKASVALAKIVKEMERRYDVFEQSKTKNIATYNAYVEKENQNRTDDAKLEKMPFIVVIVDELADLMMVASKDVEASIMRITQMARAAGIHLIIATQRPSTDVITGVVKANIPSRISFAVSSSIDSRTILDMTGAEKLLGKGDMLFLPMGEATAQRVQGAYISDDDIKKLIDYTIEQQTAEYDDNMMNLDAVEQTSTDQSSDAPANDGNSEDPLYNEIVEFVIQTQKASASLLQRRFKLGYNRAARIIDELEEKGIIGPQNGSKPREVLVQLESSEGSNE